MIRTTEQILTFNNTIKSTQSIKQLDNLYTKIICSNLDNGIVEVFKDMIELKAENIQIKGFTDN
jgi:hypothetical protein